MKNLNIFKYIRRLLPLIIVFCMLATYGVYINLKKSNNYIASEVIHFNDPAAEEGLAPTGEKLEVGYIKSSAVMSKVVDRMGLVGIYSVDNLISRINITPVPDEDKMAQKAAKLEEGEEYIYEPSTFIVSFGATNAEGAEFARTVLDETLDVYFAEFSQKYVNVAPANNTIEKLDAENYDYIEMMELIDSSIDDTLATLYQRIEKNQYYRATQTGVSFEDIVGDFTYLSSVKVSEIFSKIYKYQLTKNKELLISDYNTRIDNNNISNVKEESIVEDLVQVIDAYVTKMRQSGNTNITSEYILDNLHERNLQDYQGDQTVTYDELIYGWRDHNEAKEHAIIDSAYASYVIDVFSQCSGACGGVCQGSGQTCSEICNTNYQAMKTDVETQIGELIRELNYLYDITKKTNDEYNEYLGASYISVLSTASVRESVNVLLYTIIAFLFFMVICCGGAIVLARIADIINYIFYTDHLTGLYNRSFFDKYLKSMDKKLLDDGTVFATIDISNLIKINAEFSRQKGDEIIKLFKNLIKECSGKAKATFIYNGNGSFIIIYEESDYITVEDIFGLFKIRLDEREENSDIDIEYKIGIAETFKENKTARKLLSEAMKNKKDYISECDNI